MARTTKNPLTLDEHRALASRLFQEQNDATHLAVELGNRYGKTSKLRRRAERHADALLNLRSELDDELARAYPDEFKTQVYFGRPWAATTD